MNGHDYLRTLSNKKSFQYFEDLNSSDPDFDEFFNSVVKDSKIYQEMCLKNQILKWKSYSKITSYLICTLFSTHYIIYLSTTKSFIYAVLPW